MPDVHVMGRFTSPTTDLIGKRIKAIARKNSAGDPSWIICGKRTQDCEGVIRAINEGMVMLIADDKGELITISPEAYDLLLVGE